MSKVIIHRCILRIVRRGGWSWGPQPQKLLQGAVNALPELLARELAALWPDDVEREIAAPIRISVPVKMSELLAAANAAFDDDATQTSSSMPEVSARIAQAARTAFEREHIASVAYFESETQPGGKRQEDVIETAKTDSPDSAVLRLLISWQRDGALKMRLADFSPAALEAWHRRLIGVESNSVNPDAVSQETIDEFINDIATRMRNAPLDREAILRRRIIVLTETSVRFKLRRCIPILLASLNREFPLDDEAEVETVRPYDDDAVETPVQQRGRSSQSAAKLKSPSPQPLLTPYAPRRERQETDRYIASALPFLLLGPLSHLGYLKTLAATLEATNCLKDAPLFATALAYKVLDPPVLSRGRNRATIEAAAAFAALEQPVSEQELAYMARHLSDCLSPLEASLSGALIADRDQRRPLLLHRAGANGEYGFLLSNIDGVLPIKWADNFCGLRRTLIQLDSSVVLIPQATAEPELLKWMDIEGFRFLTDAPPARGERWRALRRPPLERWWTNDAINPETALVKMARSMREATEDAEKLVQSLAVERPSILSAEESFLDRCITSAAAAALGMIALELWRERESTAPHLAMERFRDLDARIRYSQEAVRVSLPLGRRFYDLRDHGLLENVFDAPWLGDRPLIFTSS